MDTQINIEDLGQLQLSDGEQQELVSFVKQAWDKGKRAREKYEPDWEDARKAYLQQPDPIKDKRLEWRSNIFLPWAYNAIESWHAYMMGMMVPKDDDFLTIDARTPDDEEANDLMESYLQYVFKNNGLSERFGDFLKRYAISGPAVIKVYWRKDARISHEWEQVPQVDPMTGQVMAVQKRVQKPVTTYNNVWFDIVDIKDFVFYPAHGDIDRTTRIHQTWRHLEDLKAAAEAGEVNYFNLEEIDEEEDSLIEMGRYHDDDGKPVAERGVRLKEAWIHRVKIGGKVYKNVVATIADDKTLIRFQPNPYGMGKSPFIYDCMHQDGDSLLGWGLLHPGMSLLRYANFLTNAKADSLKRGLYPMFKYVDDGVFNPYNVVARPHAMVKVGDLSNLVPIVDGLAEVAQAYPEIESLRVEYDETTVPKVVRGQMEVNNATATEINAIQNTAGGKMDAQGQRVNEKVLKPLLEMAYLMIRERAQEEPEVLADIARVVLPATETQQDPQTGQPITIQKPVELLMTELPKFLPLPEVDIKLVGYEHNIRKQERLAAIAQTLPQVINTPANKYIKWSEVLEEVLKLQGLTPDQLMMDKDQQAQADQAEQANAQHQQDLLILKEKTQLDLEKQKIELDFHYKMAQLELEREKFGLEQVKAFAADDNANKQMEQDAQYKMLDMMNQQGETTQDVD